MKDNDDHKLEDDNDNNNLEDDNDNLEEGYFITDLNGDGFVDGSDFPILFNNSDNLIESMHPY